MPPTENPGYGALLAEDLRAHAAWLRRLAVTLAGAGRAADGDDAVGDTLAAAVERPPADRKALRPWLATVLRNFVRLRARGERNRRRREELAAAAAALVERRIPTPEELLARHEALSLLGEEVRRLEEPYRSTVLLCYAEDLPPAEIARRLGVPPGTVRWRLKRGLDQIRTRLAARGAGRAWAVALGLGGSSPAAPVAAGLGATVKGVLFMKASSKGALVVAVVLLALAAWVTMRAWRPRPTPGGPGAGVVDHRRQGSPPRRFGEEPLPEGAAAAAIAGVVRDAAGAAIAGAMVAIAPAAGVDRREVSTFALPRLIAAGVTGTDGRFHLPRLPPGFYRVTASAAGYLPGGRDAVAARAGETTDDLEIRLQPGGHTLAGRVLDTGGGAIAGARLRVWIDGGWAASAAQPMALARTDGEGTYHITLPAGTHGFLVEADGYAAQRASVMVAGAQRRDFRLHPASSISGRVVRRGSGEPVAGARVRADSRGYFAEADCDGAGAFTITDLEPGDYALHALAAPLAGRSVRPVTVGLAERVDGVVLEVETGRGISGRVMRPGGAPVPGVRVVLRESLAFQARGGASRGEALTGQDGRYRVAAVLPGAYTVAADDRGGPARRLVTMARADVEGIDLEFSDTATVRGRVTDQQDRPVAGAVVRAHVDEPGRGPEGVSGPAATDAEGRFLIEKVLPGPLTVTASHPERGSGFTDAGPLRASEERAVSVRLGRRGAHIRGRVRWEDGSPAGGLVVQSLTMGEAGRASAATGPDGRYAIGPFEPGWLVMVSVEQAAAWQGAGAHTEVNRPIRIKSAEDVEGIDFELPRPGARLGGVVVGPDGKPLGGTVVWTRPGPAGARVATGDDGRFLLEGLVHGQYLVHAEHPGLPPAQVADVPAGTEDLRIRIETGAVLAGRVVRAGGGRLGPFTIWARSARPADRGPPALDDRGAPVSHRWVQAEDGAFEIGGLAAGVYDLVVATIAGDSGGLPAIAVRSGQARRDLTVAVTSGMTVVGQVVDIDSRAPLAGVVVRATSERGAREVRTDAGGVFRLEGVMRGVSNRLELELAGHLPYSREWTAPVEGGTRDLGTLPLLAARYGEKRPGPVGRIGMVFSQDDDGRILVRNASPASPAGQAGLRPGDVILSVDRRDVRNADMGNFVLLVAGKPGDPVVFEVRTGGAPPRAVTVVRM